jgi:AraC-like DNA-binding protein
VYLSPLGAMAFLGCPSGELTGIDVHGEQACGPMAREIQERIQAAPTWAGRFAVLDEVLSRQLALSQDDGRVGAGVGGLGGRGGEGGGGGRQDVSAEVGFAWRRLLESRGTVAVSSLAAETGWSDRHLRSRFAREIGLTPKAAGRVVRFDHARKLLRRRAESSRSLDLAALAAHCGYYDQAHLDSEFRALAGAAPTRWLSAEFAQFRNLQAASGRRGQE